MKLIRTLLSLVGLLALLPVLFFVYVEVQLALEYLTAQNLESRVILLALVTNPVILLSLAFGINALASITNHLLNDDNKTIKDYLQSNLSLPMVAVWFILLLLFN